MSEPDEGTVPHRRKILFQHFKSGSSDHSPHHIRVILGKAGVLSSHYLRLVGVMNHGVTSVFQDGFQVVEIGFDNWSIEVHKGSKAENVVDLAFWGMPGKSVPALCTNTMFE